MSAKQELTVVHRRASRLPAFLQPEPGVDQVEVTEIASGEVVLFWDVPAAEAKQFVRELQADLATLASDELLDRWGLAVTEFAGFTPATFSFFAELAEHNTREWFAEHRAIYDDAVRGPLELLFEELADENDGRVKLFRQHRDVRFSPDKSPYKTTTYGLITDRPRSEAPLYLQLSAEGLFAGSGYHILMGDQLARFRAAIDDDARGPELAEAVCAVETGGVETFGEALKTAPRGYPRDHPRIGLLRHKQLIAGRRLPAGTIPRDAALEHARSTWAAITPMNDWLDAHVGPSTEPPPPSRFRR